MIPMKILTIVGARPQFIKAATLSRVISSNSDVREIILHTGQHYDQNMSEIFFRELNIPEPDINLEVGSGSHGVQTGAMLAGIEEQLLKHKPDITLVYGDTNSTLAGALASVKLHIPVAHVEAGLRSFNRAMPEEINRIATDSISDLLLAPTQTAMSHLAREGLGQYAHFTGDVMYDSILFYRAWVSKDPHKYLTPGLPDSYYLATIHRAENTDNPENLKAIFQAFESISQPVVLPVHPRTRKIIADQTKIPSNLYLTDPVGYLQMMKLTLDSIKVLTDSGGLQKEAYFLGRPCITLRTETEWVETLHDGWNTITGTDPEKITTAIHQPFPTSSRRGDFGDGKAAEAILKKLQSF
jgi:UDP-GlcNAc3NAcA epimerase